MSSTNNIEQNKLKDFETLMELFEFSNSGLWKMDSFNNMNLFNKSFYKEFDISLENLSLDSWAELIHPEDRSLFSDKVEMQVKSNIENVKSIYRALKKNGEYAWIEALGVGYYGDEGEFLYMIGSHTDITEYKNYEEHVYNLAYKDALTGLYNESKLIEDCDDIIAKNVKCSMLYINLHSFLLLQDTFGRNYTTEALKEFADILKESFPSGSRLYRLKSQEVVVIHFGDDSNDEIIRIINEVTHKVGSKIYKNIRTFYPYMHVGICELPQNHVTSEALADKCRLTLRYANKLECKNYAFYNNEIAAKIRREIHIETNLMKAIEKNQLYLKYQPIIDPKTSIVDSYEALIRWKDEIQGEIYPDEFIPVAEKTSDIVEIGYFVIKEACRFIKRYESAIGNKPKVAVNVSAIQLLQDDFASTMLSILESECIPTDKISIEITESLMLNKQKSVIDQLHTLRDNGIGIALDDFGIGYSSLSTLADIPLNKLKVDREIILNLINNNTMHGFIKSLVMLCHETDIKVVAEGIEDERYLSEVVNMEFDYIQGYYYSKPLIESEIIEKTKR